VHRHYAENYFSGLPKCRFRSRPRRKPKSTNRHLLEAVKSSGHPRNTIPRTIKLGGQRPRLSSLRSPNARNKFAFALGDRKLLATLKFLYVKLSDRRPRLSSLRSPNAINKFAFALGDRKLLATLKFLYVKLGGQKPQLSSLRSPNAINKFAFALGDRKLLATLKFLYVKLGGWSRNLVVCVLRTQ
jgi:hypothetical protein